MTFERTSHIGARAIDIAKEEKGQYYFAGRNLGKKLPADVLKSWQAMAAGPTVDKSTRSCPAGNFKFIKKEKTTTTLEGCTQGETYGRYIEQLENVRNFAKSL